MRLRPLSLAMVSASLAAAGALAALYAAGPKTYAEMAARDAARCTAAHGGGQWAASSGTSLAQFCQAAADLRALEDDRADHPERH